MQSVGKWSLVTHVSRNILFCSILFSKLFNNLMKIKQNLTAEFTETLQMQSIKTGRNRVLFWRQPTIS